MDGRKLLDQMKGLINAHTESGCSIYQQGYKDDYFKIFRCAHDNRLFDSNAHPRMTGDAIRDYFYGDWLSEDNDENKKRLKTMNNVLAMWDEWHYALEKYGV